MTTAITPIEEIRNALTRMEPQIRAALPAQITPAKFIRVAQTAINQNRSLLEADRQSLYGACMRAAQDGLLPDGREGAIVAYGNKAQWMPMVAGLMKKVRNSGEISTWSLQVVKEKDEFSYQLGDDERVVHKPALVVRGKTIGAYSIVTLRTGEKSREFMNLEEIEAIRKRSKATGGPWQSDYDEMAKKTVARRHSKRLPMSTDLADFIHQDDEMTDLQKPAEEKEVVKEAEAVVEPKKPSRVKQIVEAKVEEPTVVPDEMPEDEVPI